MECEELYFRTYGKEPEGISFCPYRVSPLGAHIDHQNGVINGLAIDKGIHIVYSTKNNGVIEVQSVNFPGKRAQFHVSGVPESAQGDFADHLRGATKELAEKYALKYGLSAVIEGDLPIGGLSSSAAVIIAFLSALARVNGIILDDWETIMIAKAAENNYVGVNCGKLDQSCEVLCRKEKLLYLDCLDDKYELISTSQSMKPYKIAIFFSGLERSLATSAYNLRQDECKAAAYSLLAYAGMNYGKFKDTVLRQVPREVFDEYGSRLPENFRKRAEHYFSEYDRAKKGAKAWRDGNLDEYGSLIFESGKSSVENYECGCPELISLYKIMVNTRGIYGGRFSGAGFKGCCMALIDPDYSEDVMANVKEKYLSIYPELSGKYTAALCDSADGVYLGGVK
ncbi:GHMP family kinase ATP-binding protein [Butyrivibrio sp. YAB3001]|uniref:GHMP family kinase ATP-binding protein n=1 Tax=Butyrivibrio sp. YAB3001 TaxID=1520812 RepID=UPI0008F62B46|nr:galactokinase family protein [Butyrivibrio sp. YAB3001]SFC12393.1 galactokinase [Butyrivibrio sp. YAB3001]